LASVLGLLLFLQGIFTLTRGLALRDETPFWWLDVVAGALITALAIWVSTSRPGVGARRADRFHPDLGRVPGHLQGRLRRRAGLLAPAARHAGHSRTTAGSSDAAAVFGA
jgi:hypothetical protein